MIFTKIKNWPVVEANKDYSTMGQSGGFFGHLHSIGRGDGLPGAPLVAGKPCCYYCNQPVGYSHGEDCVMVKKKVEVEWSFTGRNGKAVSFIQERHEPYSHEKRLIEFGYNEGTMCVDFLISDVEGGLFKLTSEAPVNLLEELKALSEENGCLCAVMKATMLREVDMTPVVGSVR